VLAVFSLLDLAPDDWVTVLSGQDYPLRPLREYEEHLASCGADMLLEEPQNGPDEELLLDRYRARSYSVPAWAVNRWLRKSVQLVPGLSWHPQPSGSPPRVDVARLRTPFRHGFRVHRGNDLYALNGRALRALLNAPPRLLRYYSRTRIPSESYTHTVLLNDPSLVNRNELLHFAVWERSSHPEWLTEADLPACIASRRWFARKFDADEPVLDRLDALLGPQG
jgi:hypothetical protein